MFDTIFFNTIMCSISQSYVVLYRKIRDKIDFASFIPAFFKVIPSNESEMP